MVYSLHGNCEIGAACRFLAWRIRLGVAGHGGLGLGRSRGLGYTIFYAFK